MRDELFLRGFVLRLFAEKKPSLALGRAALAACAVANLAATVGAGSSNAAGITGAALGGVAFGALWLRDRGAWLAWGAHTAWLWSMGTLARGGVLDVRAVAGSWGGGDTGLAGGWASVVGLAPCAAAAVVWARRR
jgi:hypothetical protein